QELQQLRGSSAGASNDLLLKVAVQTPTSSVPASPSSRSQDADRTAAGREAGASAGQTFDEAKEQELQQATLALQEMTEQLRRSEANARELRETLHGLTPPQACAASAPATPFPAESAESAESAAASAGVAESAAAAQESVGVAESAAELAAASAVTDPADAAEPDQPVAEREKSVRFG
ncbi:unnamed protein product, partial [Polarella glacialis]